MVMCWVKNCRHYCERDNCRFFRFPRDETTRKKWIELIRRPDKGPSQYSVVCSCHFLNQQKQNLPTIFPQLYKPDGKKRRKTKSTKKTASVKSSLNLSQTTSRILEEHKYCANPSTEVFYGNNIQVAQFVEVEASKDLVEHTPCDKDSVDITLAVEGRYLTAHKVLLSMFSPYFKELFKTSPCKHPIVFMKDVSYVAMSDLLQYMYRGKVNVKKENFTTFIKTAESLQIKGLSNNYSNILPTPKSPSSKEHMHHEIVTAEPLVMVEAATSALTSEVIIPFKPEPYNWEEPLDDPLGETNADEIGKRESMRMLETSTEDRNEDRWMVEGGDDVSQIGTDVDPLGGEFFFQYHERDL